MKDIATKLGLPEEATPEQINNRLDEVIVRAGKADEMESAAEAEEILNRHAKRIPEGSKREDWKADLVKNREVTERILSSLPEREEKKPAADEPRKPLTNREKAGVPSGGIGGDDGEGAAEKRAARISNRANQLLDTKGARNLADAYRRAEDELDSEEAAKS